MAKQIIDARVRQKVGTEAEWLANDLKLLDGEVAVVRTGDGTPVNLKFGDGNKKFSELPYFIDFNNAQRISSVSPGALPTPAEENVYMVVTEIGDYTFGGSTIASITEDGYQATLWWDGTAWLNNGVVRVKGDEAEPTGVVEEGNTRAVSGGEVYDFVEERLDNNIVLGDNLIDTIGKFRTGSYSGQIGNTYSFTASNNWLSMQPIVVDGDIFKIGQTYTLSGQGGVSTLGDRILFINENNIVIDKIYGTGTAQSLITPVTFTIPTGTTKILLNIAGVSGSGLNPEQSPYHNTLMINSGSLVKPYSKYGYKLNLKQKICYVSPTGNDDNLGTEDNPIYSISKAKEILDENGQLIFLDGDYFDYDLDLSAFKTMKGLAGSKVRFIYGHRIDQATLVSGFSKVYSSPYTHNGTWTNVYSLWQHDIEDDRTNIQMDKRHIVHNGLVNRLQSYRLTSVNSIEEVELSATPCYYYDSANGIMYFQKVNGSDLSLNPIVIPRNESVVSSNVQQVNHSNFSILYKAITTSMLTGELRDISCMYVNNLAGCFITNNTISLRLVRCRAGGGSNDGFNGHRTTTVTDVYNNYVVLELVDCWAHDCVDDAESHHGYCRVFVRGGLYEYSGSGCTPASGCHGYYENVTVQNCEVTGFQAQGTSLDNGIGTNIHCYNCVSDSNGKNYEGRGDDSRFVNSISITPTISHFSGVGFRKLNCEEIN